MNTPPLAVVMIGATGAVGGHALQALINYPQVERITSLGRRSIMVSIFGATIGHRMNRIKVQRDNIDKKINFGFAIVRFIVKAALGWFSLFTVSTNKEKKAIHDIIAKSVVVHDQ